MENIEKFSLKDFGLSLVLVTMGVISRLIPHVPDAAPTIMFALYLGMRGNKLVSVGLILLMQIIADSMLAIQMGYPVFGLWSLFTYTGILSIGALGFCPLISKSTANFFGASLFVTLFFWLWTNFGVWLSSDIYPHTFLGFELCYYYALPFLASSTAATIVWFLIIVAYERFLVYFNIRRIRLFAPST